jgi:hypothetical protein
VAGRRRMGGGLPPEEVRRQEGVWRQEGGGLGLWEGWPDLYRKVGGLMGRCLRWAVSWEKLGRRGR